MVVSYDEKFDRKVDLGAEAILKARNVATREWEAALPAARQEARMVLLTAKAVDAGQIA
jgi:hypothetical protein